MLFFVLMTSSGCAQKTSDLPEPTSRPLLFSDCADELSLFCNEDLDDLPESNETDTAEEKEFTGENLRSSIR